MDAMIRNKGIYYCSRFYGGVHLGVVSSPVEVSKRSQVQVWLEWLADLLENWAGTKIKTICSPSAALKSMTA